jgi:hypothetical protein
MTSTHAPKAHTIIVIPCAADKLADPAPAVELYDSPNFRHMLGAACAEATDNERVMGVSTKVMILSAKHGLVELGTIVDPYNTKMGDADQVSHDEIVDQLVTLAPQAIISMLPGRYLAALNNAVTFVNEEGSDEDPWIDLMDAYEAAPGIGFQRGVASSLVRTTGQLEPVA